MVDDKDLQNLACAICETALKAGEVIMRYYRCGVEVRRKPDASPVTDADHAAEELILEHLAKLAPATPVIAEESVAAGIVPAVGERFFLVDPLDGTKEYISRTGEFTVNIALVEGTVPVFGLIYAPALNRLFVTLGQHKAVSAAAEPGASCGLKCLPQTPLATRAAPPGGLVAAVSRFHINDATMAFLRAHGITRSESIGSSLKFCLLAEGRADVYPRLAPTSEWDTAAGHAILAAAGGVVLTEAGAPLSYGKAGTRYINPGFIAWGRPPVSGVVREKYEDPC